MKRRGRGVAPKARANRRRPARWSERAAVRALRESLRSPRRLAFFAALALGCFTVGLGLRYSIDHPYFSVARIDVLGTKRLAPDQVRAWLGTVVGRSMWRVSPGRLAAELRARPELAGAEVRRLFPRRLVVRVEERERRAVVRTSRGRLFVVDAEGVVVGPAGADDADLPIVTLGEGMDDGGVRRWEVASAVGVAELLEREAGALSVSELSLRRGRGGEPELVGFGDRARLVLRLGWGRWAEKARALRRVLSYEESRRGRALADLAGTIDLREPGTVVGRWAAREGAA